MYILGIDFGDGETSAAVLEVNDNAVEELKDLKVHAIDDTATNGEIDNETEGNAGIGDYAKKIKEIISASVFTLKDVPIKGQSKEIPSVLCWDYEEDNWILGPDTSSVKDCFSGLDLENQVPKMMAYFKGALTDGSGEKFGGNNLKSITDYNKGNWGEFIKATFKSIIKNNKNFKADGSNFKLYVACPSQWEPKQKEAYFNFLRSLGLPCEAVVEESRAANLSFSNTIPGDLIRQNGSANVLIIDYGSSTIDFTWYGKGMPVNHGAELGARNVEKIIFDYMVEHEDKSALPTFKKLAAILGNGNDEEGAVVAKVQITYALRFEKERFCKRIAKGAKHSKLNGVFGLNLSDSLDMTDNFAFNNPRGGYEQDKFEKEILKDYIADVKKVFVQFRDRKNVGANNIKCVMLTGGASQMPFVKKITEEVFHVTEGDENHPQTLFQDTDPQFSISKGIARFGLYKYLSDPIRNEIEDTLNKTWLDRLWIQKVLNNIVPDVVYEVYNNRLCYIVDQWAKPNSDITYDETKSMYRILDPIINCKASHSNSEEAYNLWDYVRLSEQDVKSNPKAKNGSRSAHALLWEIYNELSLDNPESNKEIDDKINAVLTQKVNDSVQILFKKLLSIYFDNTDLPVTPTLPDVFNIKVKITEVMRMDYLASLTEAVCKGVEGTGGIVTINTFNKDRNANFGFNPVRNNLKPKLKEVLGESCKVLKPTFDSDVISASIEKSVNKKYDEIKFLCDKETYKM